MSQPMQIIPGEMTTTAAALSSLADEVNQARRLLRRQWHRLDSGWEWYARVDAGHYYRTAMRDLDRMEQMLAQMASALEETGNLIQAADQAAVTLFTDNDVPLSVAAVAKATAAGGAAIGTGGAVGVPGDAGASITGVASARVQGLHANSSGVVLGVKTVAPTVDLKTVEYLEIPNFSNISWAQRFAWTDKLDDVITKAENTIGQFNSVIAESQKHIATIDAELADLETQRAGLQEAAGDWRNKLKFSEDGLRLGFDDKFPDAPWRTRADDYESQLAEIDRQIAELQQQRQTCQVQQQQVIRQRDVLQGKLVDMHAAQTNLQKQMEALKRFDGQTPATTTTKRPWSYVDAPVTNVETERDPRVYNVVLDQFAVGNNSRYTKNQQHKGETYCNIFVWDSTRAMGAEIPHWVDQSYANPVPQGQGIELSANGSISWLETHGVTRGWQTVSAEQAQNMANQGNPIVATYKNPGGIGHVAMVRPGEYSKTDAPRIAQAGGRNFNDDSVANGFGNREVVYYAHN